MSSEVTVYDQMFLDPISGAMAQISVVRASDYAALEAENARLQSEFDDLAKRYGTLQTGEDSLLAKVVTERDAALAQLAAIQGGMGEVPAASQYRIGVNGEWLYSSDREYLQRERDEYESQCEPDDCDHETPEPIYSLADVQRITAAMAAEVERLRASCQSMRDWIDRTSFHGTDAVELMREADKAIGREEKS